MRILITGGTGFVGRAIVASAMDAGHEVHVTARGSAGNLGPDIASHVVDLLSASDEDLRTLAATGYDALIHCAWVTNPAEVWQSDANGRWVEASERLVAAAINAGVGRVIGVGSCAEYDWSHSLLKEGVTPCAPTSPYGEAKLALYERLAIACGQASVPLAWTRPFFLYGAHERRGRLVSDLLVCLLNDREAPCTDGLQVRDFMHVAEAGAAIVAVLDSQVTGPVNIAKGEGVSVRQLVMAFASALRRENLVRFGAQPRRADDPPELVGDITRLCDDVGFRPKANLATGIDATISWWRAQNLTV